MTGLFAKQRFAYVVHLAAQAGVAHSAVDPNSYVDANLVGFANILEGCRRAQSRHLVYASSSSVYGANRQMPLRVSDRVDEPLSLYGATKRANELMAYALRPSIRIGGNGTAFLYGLWAMGPPRHGGVAFTEDGPSSARQCRARYQPESRPRFAPAATDNSPPKRCVRLSAARQCPLQDEKNDGGEVS